MAMVRSSGFQASFVAESYSTLIRKDLRVLALSRWAQDQIKMLRSESNKNLIGFLKMCMYLDRMRKLEFKLGYKVEY